MSDRDPRPLLIAMYCNPEWVSVPLVGWSHARAIMKLTDGAHVVTHVRNREAMTRAGLVEGRDFTSVDTERIQRPIHVATIKLRGGRTRAWTLMTAVSSLLYPYFESLVWRRFRDRLASGEFNLVHRITPLSPTMVSPIARKCRSVGVPFVIGPLNGGLPWPPGYEGVRRAEREWLSYFRSLHRLMPGYDATRRNAAAMIIGSAASLEQEPAKYRGKCVYLPENAIDPDRFSARRTRKADRPLRVVFVGRLVPYKGADVLIDAAADLARAGAVDVEIIGSGPQEQELAGQIERLGVGDRIRLAGFVPHDQLQHRLADRDVFAFPSVREFGGAVVLETMAVGLVPVVVDYGGPGELATDRVGYRIPIGSRQQLVERFRAVLADLADNPAKVDQRSELAIRRTFQQFTWDAKAKQVMEVYRAVLDGTPLPDFPMPVPDPAGS